MASHESWFWYYFVLSLETFISHVAPSSGQNSNLFNTLVYDKIASTYG